MGLKAQEPFNWLMTLQFGILREQPFKSNSRFSGWFLAASIDYGEVDQVLRQSDLFKPAKTISQRWYPSQPRTHKRQQYTLVWAPKEYLLSGLALGPQDKIPGLSRLGEGPEVDMQHNLVVACIMSTNKIEKYRIKIKFENSCSSCHEPAHACRRVRSWV